MVSPKVIIISPLFSNATGTSSPRISALVKVWLVVGLHVGDAAVMVASHSTQSQSPFTWYSFTVEFGIYVRAGDCANDARSPVSTISAGMKLESFIGVALSVCFSPDFFPF
jgi:hypothetical protein